MKSPSHPRERMLDTAGVRARNGVYLAFIGSGFAFSSWASRIPQVRDALGLSPAQLGILLLAIAIGSLIALPMAGFIVGRLGAARTITISSIALAGALALAAIGYNFAIAPIAIGLFILGFSNGIWDVAMNVQGAVVERRLDRSLMSRFHAGYSVGTVGGALIGVAMVSMQVPVTIHLLTVAALVAGVVPFAVRGFLPEFTRTATGSTAPVNPLRAWKERRTLLIGVFVLCMAFTEGTGNDWLAVAVIDGYGTSAEIGTLTFATFLASMTVVRWNGPQLLDKFGRVLVLRGSAVLAFCGLLLVVFGQGPIMAIIGSILWGSGAALGFPVGMSAAADEEHMAAARVSVVSSIGYTAFLAGPPLIGLLGDHVGVLKALTVAVGLLAIAILLAGVNRPIAGTNTLPPGPKLTR